MEKVTCINEEQNELASNDKEKDAICQDNSWVCEHLKFDYLEFEFMP